ncbi:MAG: hypothetical protein DIU79_00805 [Actinobacteria bacterium]|nr:MAG: hypothetical protein DIU79_00805 [Actinomycetota bacterium]
MPSAPPAPPPGPGVRPPFAAPPTEGRAARLWLGIGAAGLAALLCCGGGVAAMFGLVITGTKAINEQARVVVGDYLDAVRQEEYDRAYAMLCDSEQQRESPPEFERRMAAAPRIRSYTIHDVTLAHEIVVPVDVTYDPGGQRTVRVVLEQDKQTGQLEVCGVR